MSPFWLLAAFLLAAAVAGGAYRWGALTTSGAWAAALVGGAMLGFGGWPWAALLLGFFLPSTLLSFVAPGRKAALKTRFAKSNARDAAQVLANGGVAALCALGHAWFPAPGWWAAAAGALAAATADTWGTEIGVLSPSPPRDVRHWRPVPPGTSGAVSTLGLGASALGSLWLGLLALGGADLRTGLAVTLGGFLGALADSLLGATVQVVYFCPACGKTTEHHPRHTCGQPTHPIQGWRGLDNDGVNLLATLVGALTAALLAGWR
ncbi:MAG TPA: DUF92 domain-containing protein [Anaerolineae bacterium]|nr:DUF92 domain-containing protein [Anaerolineae bacterium]HID84140.1 DUF92 domain-containing protein [Anaerolineales bacterium]HIQ08530.1 DUF92 domain-containing protein [Anaerolineaceae bacterium]